MFLLYKMFFLLSGAAGGCFCGGAAAPHPPTVTMTLVLHQGFQGLAESSGSFPSLGSRRPHSLRFRGRTRRRGRISDDSYYLDSVFSRESLKSPPRRPMTQAAVCMRMRMTSASAAAKAIR